MEALKTSRKVDMSQVVMPEHAVRNLLTELRANRPYVISHGDQDYKDRAQARLGAIGAALDRMFL
jgi:hypothetical protein